MHRPNGLRLILSLGSALARLAAVVPLGAPLHSAGEKKLERKYARHTHRPRGLGSIKYGAKRARPRGATSTLAKTRRLLAKQHAEGRL
ncbi:hypothetical protein LL06_00900 [Hoeflea sp. BAL378]|uniref:hypothetical protein n=1 Tax=Hoeflea sp. BAL378 TaxID=1547437 RepID=UPI00051362E1|nr:hypothetical protein [Hoeflea sp. BAL378]KGF71182.1 hypothetical protein LL06_00900 [Hoeflea sp. BAL378]